VTTPIEFPAGHVPTPSGLEEVDRISAAVRTSDSDPVNNSTTMVLDTDLTLPVVADTTYRLKGRLLYTAASAADFRFGWDYPIGLTMSYGALAIATATTDYIIYPNNEADLPAVEGAGVSSPRDVWLDGVVTVSSTAGDLTLKWAQLVANVSDAILRTGSYIELTRWT
jgi:hypothetical protein